MLLWRLCWSVNHWAVCSLCSMKPTQPNSRLHLSLEPLDMSSQTISFILNRELQLKAWQSADCSHQPSAHIRQLHKTFHLSGPLSISPTVRTYTATTGVWAKFEQYNVSKKKMCHNFVKQEYTRTWTRISTNKLNDRVLSLKQTLQVYVVGGCQGCDQFRTVMGRSRTICSFSNESLIWLWNNVWSQSDLFIFCWPRMRNIL